MATFQDQVDDFIGRAQGRIATLGNDMANSDGVCNEDDLFLIEELEAGIGLLQSCCDDDCGCDILTENEKYEIMSYLIIKGDLDPVPLYPMISLCVSNVIQKCCAGAGLIPPHNSLTGLQGGQAGQYYHLTAAEYDNLVKPNYNGILAPSATNNKTQKYQQGSDGFTYDTNGTLNGIWKCDYSDFITASWQLIWGSGPLPITSTGGILDTDGTSILDTDGSAILDTI